MSTVSRCDRKRARPPTAKVNAICQMNCTQSFDPPRSLRPGSETPRVGQFTDLLRTGPKHAPQSVHPSQRQSPVATSARLCHHSSIKELLGDARAHVIPRQLVPLSELARRLLVDARTQRRERRLPGGSWIHLAPRIEARACPPRRARSHRPSPRRRERAHPRASRCAGRAARGGSGGSASPGACTPAWPPADRAPHIPSHWNGVCGLGTKLRDADVDAEASAARAHPPPDLARPDAEVDDALHLGVRLAAAGRS